MAELVTDTDREKAVVAREASAGKSLAGRLGARVGKRWRAWLRALHRDAGYLAVGLTVIYAASGLAINHVKDWDPNFTSASGTHHIDAGAIPGKGSDPETDDATALAAAEHVLGALAIDSEAREAYWSTDDQLEIQLDNRSLVVETATGTVFDEYQKPRFFLRVANWLHYNRGKPAWTFIADFYAGFLLFLAFSGMFMLKGKLGLRGRGAIFIGLGVAVPILYVTLAGGPGS